MKVETIRRRLSDSLEMRVDFLKQQLADLQAAYRREAEPMLRELAEIEGIRPVQYIVTDIDERERDAVLKRLEQP